MKINPFQVFDSLSKDLNLKDEDLGPKSLNETDDQSSLEEKFLELDSFSSGHYAQLNELRETQILEGENYLFQAELIQKELKEKVLTGDGFSSDIEIETLYISIDSTFSEGLENSKKITTESYRILQELEKQNYKVDDTIISTVQGYVDVIVKKEEKIETLVEESKDIHLNSDLQFRTIDSSVPGGLEWSADGRYLLYT